MGAHLSVVYNISGQIYPLSVTLGWKILVLKPTEGPLKGKLSSLNSIWNCPPSKGEVYGPAMVMIQRVGCSATTT